MAYTQGPWNLHSPTEGDPITGDGSYCITGQDGGVLANIVPKDSHKTPGNARLIAMAPTLLKLLEGFISTLDVEDDTPEYKRIEAYYNDNIAMFNCAIDTYSYIQKGRPIVTR